MGGVHLQEEWLEASLSQIPQVSAPTIPSGVPIGLNSGCVGFLLYGRPDLRENLQPLRHPPCDEILLT